MRILTIAAAARAAEVNVETIRFYERRGLIAQPARPQQGARHYPEETIARLRFGSVVKCVEIAGGVISG